MSSQNNNYVFLLVPGSFATPKSYIPLIEALQAQGQNVQTIDLLSVGDGTRLPPATMQDDAAHIRAAILSILDDPSSPKNVVVAPHSYGGIPTTCALKNLSREARQAEGKSTFVSGIIYNASFILSEGESLRGIMAELNALHEPMKTGVPGGYLPPIQPEFAQFIFNDLTNEKAMEFLSTMEMHASDSYNGEVNYAAWKEIPSVTLIPSLDVIVPVALQEIMYERAVSAGGLVERVGVEGAGHALPVSRVDVVVEEMVKLARRG